MRRDQISTGLSTIHLSRTTYSSRLQQAIVNEQLGQDDDTDVLTVSFSANDYVGHRYGPYSQEVMDVTLQNRSPDRNAARFRDARGTVEHADSVHGRSRRVADSGTRSGRSAWVARD